MLKTASSFVLGRPSPCDVPKEYDSVAGLPAALLEGRFEHPVRLFPEMVYTFSIAVLSVALLGTSAFLGKQATLADSGRVGE